MKGPRHLNVVLCGGGGFLCRSATREYVLPCGGCLRPWFMARPSMTPVLLYTVYCPCVQTTTYTVINQCCPNRCFAIGSSTVVTPTQVVPLVLFTVQFFLSHVWVRHSVSRSLPLFCPCYVFIANLQSSFQALQHFFFSKGSAPFFVCFVPMNICSF